MSISDDGIPVNRTTLLNGALAGEDAAAPAESGALIQPLDPFGGDGGETALIGSRFIIPTEPVEALPFPGPVFGLPPAIDDAIPRSGAPGTPVVIIGRNFDPVEGDLRFNGTQAGYFPTSTTRIETRVPNGATTGRITVNGVQSAFDFTVVQSSAPTVAGFSPQGGRPGDVVTISGSNLASVTQVRFGGAPADSFIPFSAQILQATVPQNASTGPISVTNPAGTAASAASFVVGTGFPTITSFMPQAGPPGAQVDIFGTELGGASRVTFNGADAQFSVVSGTQVRATVPGFVGSGPIRVHTPLGIAVSATSFFAGSALPRLDSFTPTSGRVNDVVTLNGADLNLATGVRIGTVRVPAISRPSNQQITLTVPPGAVTAPFFLESDAGTVQGPGVFTVLPPATTTVSGISPTSGFPGIVLFISGTGLDRVTGVFFSPGVPAQFGLAPDGRIAATVPDGAVTGPIRLETPTGPVFTPPFTVIPREMAPVVAVLTPNGGQSFNAGQVIEVNWTVFDDGQIVSQDIRYSRDGGATFQVLVPGLPGATRTLLVQIPADGASESALVSITARDNAGLTGEGRSGLFRVLGDRPPAVAVVTPNGGETFTAGQSVTISWNSSDDVGLMSHDVRFSTDGGASFQDIAVGIPGFRRNAVWTVPDQPSDRVLVSVTARDTKGQATEDRSDAFFRISGVDRPPSVVVLTPNGGEVLMPGQSVTISWNSSDDLGLASHDVRFSTDGGATFQPIATGIPGFRRNAAWTVPDQPSDRVLVSVVARDTAGQAAEDRSDAFLRIVRPFDAKPAVRVITPNGGEALAAGQTVTISWESSDDVGLASHDVRYSVDGGVTFVPIVTGIPGTRRNAMWTVPNLPSDRALVAVRATDTAGQATEDLSDQFFRILPPPVDQPPAVTVLTPNGGELLIPGQEVTVSWNSGDDVGLVSHDVTFSTDGGATFQPIALGIPGFRRNAVWTVPSQPTGLALVSVKATDTGGQTTEDRSDAFFSIVGIIDRKPMVTVLAPNGGETLQAGQTVTISWTSSDDVGLTSHDVRYSVDGGATFLPIVTGIPGTRRNALWTVPDTPGDRALVSVIARDTAGQTAEDRSDGFFRIAGTPQALSVRVLAPNGGERFLPGQTVNVSWEIGGAPVSQEVRFSADGGATFATVAAMLPGSARSAVFSLPSVQTERALVAVVARDAAGTAVEDRSDGFFRIGLPAPAFTVTVAAPNGGEQLVAGQVTTVSWTVTGDSTLIAQDVAFSADGGATFQPIATGLPGTRRSFLWTVPDAPTERGLVSVSFRDPSGALVSDVSDGFFRIVRAALAPVVTGIFPGSGPVAGGTPVTIQGSSFDARARVRIGGIDALTFPVSSTMVNAITPRAKAAGFADVAVVNPGGASGVLAGGFRYLLGSGVPTSGQIVFQSATVADPVPDPDAGLPDEDAFEALALAAELDGGSALPVDEDASAAEPAGDASTEDAPSPLAFAADAEEISRPLGRALLLPPDVEPAPVPLPGIEVVAPVAAAAPEPIVLRAGEAASIALFVEVFDADGQPLRDRVVEIVSGGNPVNSTLTVQPNPVLSFSTFIATLATQVDTPAGDYLLRFRGFTDGEPFLQIPELGVPVRILPARRRVRVFVTPERRAVEPGGQATFAVQLRRRNLPGVPVRLRVKNALPPGVTVTFDPPRPTEDTATMMVQTPPEIGPGDIRIVVTARTNVEGSRAIPADPVFVQVQAATPGVQIIAQTVEVRVTAGDTAEYELTLARMGLAGQPVRLEVDPATLPAGATASFDPAAPTGDAATLRIATVDATPAGTFTVAVRGAVDVQGAEVRGATVQLVVDAAPVPARTGIDFGPVEVTEPEGEVVALAAGVPSVKAGGRLKFDTTPVLFDTAGGPILDDVDVTVTGLPPQSTIVVDPNPARTFQPSTVTLQTAVTTPAGEYTLVFTGKSRRFPGLVYGPDELKIQVRPGVRKVALTVKPVTAEVRPGETAKYVVSLARTNATGVIVALQVGNTEVPQGTIIKFVPARTTTNRSELSITIPETTGPGLILFRVIGTTTSSGVTIEPSKFVELVIKPPLA